MENSDASTNEGRRRHKKNGRGDASEGYGVDPHIPTFEAEDSTDEMTDSIEEGAN